MGVRHPFPAYGRYLRPLLFAKPDLYLNGLCPVDPLSFFLGWGSFSFFLHKPLVWLAIIFVKPLDLLARGAYIGLRCRRGRLAL